jgi:hypothetical protein
VAAHVDPLDGNTREGERGALDRVRCTEIREDRAMVIDVGVNVEERHPGGLDRIAEGTDDIAVASLTDVGDALQQRFRGPRALRR